MASTNTHYLQEGLPRPAPSDLDQPFWEALQHNELKLQRCAGCGKFQWGPEWLCHRCHSFDLHFEAVSPTGLIYSYERVWHPVHPALKDQGAYLIVLVELPQADGVRVVGNLLGDPTQKVVIGSAVTGVFEHHASTESQPGYSLLQWEPAAH